MATVTVLYPKGVKFNMDYYIKSHMPMVMKNWGPLGLQSWKVLSFGDGMPYAVQATLEFGSKEDFEKAGASPEAKEVMGDVPNFSDKEPVLMLGDIVATS